MRFYSFLACLGIAVVAEAACAEAVDPDLGLGASGVGSSSSTTTSGASSSGTSSSSSSSSGSTTSSATSSSSSGASSSSTSSASSSTTSSSSSSSGDGTSSSSSSSGTPLADCPGATDISAAKQGTGNGSFSTQGKVNGWSCYNSAGCTVTVNGTAVTSCPGQEGAVPADASGGVCWVFSGCSNKSGTSGFNYGDPRAPARGHPSPDPSRRRPCTGAEGRRSHVVRPFSSAESRARGRGICSGSRAY